MGRLSRTLGALGLGVRRVVGKLRGAAAGRVGVSILGVALAIAMLVVVVGLAVGMAGSTTVGAEGVDLWVLPEDAGAGSAPLPVEGARIGDAHDMAASISADHRVTYATPVLLELVEVENAVTGDRAWVVAIGVVPPPDGADIAGISTGPLAADEAASEDVILTEAAATQLIAVAGDPLRVRGSDRDLRVVAIADEAIETPGGAVPVVMMELAELQAITGTAEDDLADQILVATDAEGVRADLAATYPEYAVVTRAGLTGDALADSELPAAMALGAAIVAIGVGIAFVATTMGLELTAARRSIAVLRAIGYARLSIAAVVIAETLTITGLGALGGIGLGWLGIAALNAGLISVGGLPGFATFSPFVAAVAAGAALLVGGVAVLYPLAIAWRTDVLAEVSR